MKFRYQRFPFGTYDPRKPLVARPFVPVYLVGNERRTQSPYFVLLDSGADRVIFPADLAREVGVARIEAGALEPAIGIANQRANVYYHKLAVQVLGDARILPLDVGFSRDVLLPLLGRTFFRHFKAIIFNEAKEEVELKI